MGFEWGGTTAPFTTASGGQPARFVLRQVDDNDFELGEPFNYTGVDGKVIAITPAVMGQTDLASIPFFLGWFARRHGRHTPAALMHDVLITDEPEKLPPELRVDPVEADLRFRQAMRACGVPPVRAALMWAGVAARTRWKKSWVNVVTLLVWGIAAVAGTVAFVLGISRWEPTLLAGAVLGPIPAAVLWGRQWRAGLVAGYFLWLVLLGSLPATASYFGFYGLEWIVKQVRRLRPRNRARPLSSPVPFGER